METTTRKTSDPVPAAKYERTEKSEPSAPLKHIHPVGVREEETGKDDNGKRIIRIVPEREATYLVSCKACQAEDKARMAAPTTLLNLDSTLFLVPEPEYDGMVARSYLRERYPEETLNTASSFHAEKLTYVKGAQIVVVTRRGQNGKTTGPRTKRTKDEEGTFHDAPVPAETYHDEIVESAPVIVEECMDVKPATMFSEQVVDMRELIARLSERANPYRIAAPADPKDRMYVMRLNS